MKKLHTFINATFELKARGYFGRKKKKGYHIIVTREKKRGRLRNKGYNKSGEKCCYSGGE